MFMWLNKQGVKSDDGFILQSEHRYYYHYIENNHVIKIYVEPLRDSEGGYFEEICIKNDIKWESPHEAEAISSEKLKDIRDNISTALQFMDIKHYFKE